MAIQQGRLRLRLGLLPVLALVLLLATTAATADDSDNQVNPLAAIDVWLGRLGGRLDTSLVELRSDGDRGRGLVAKQAIPPKTVFARIPLTALINIEHAMVSDLGPVIDASDLSDQEIMSVFLWHQLHGCGQVEDGGVAESNWQPFLDTLPDRQEMHLTMLWTPEQLAHLDGSLLRDFSERRIQVLEASFKRHQQSTFGKFPSAESCDWTKFTLEDFLWGMAIGWSRTHAVRVRDGEGAWQTANCLVPVADLLNTDIASKVNAECYTNDESTHFECRTRHQLAQSEELLAQYNADSASIDNHHLLMDYGFVLNDDSARRAATIGRPIPLDDPDRAKRLSVLKQHKMQMGMSLPLSFTDFELPLTYYRILCARSQVLNSKWTPSFKPTILPEEETCARDHLRVAMLEQLGRFPTKQASEPIALAQIQAAFAENCKTNPTNAKCISLHRQALAIQLRISERGLLSDLVQRLTQKETPSKTEL
ncbi:hypothetical protein CAOG_05400 [Capsaspora owczarzaki ATCC 30864]|uniref:Uncharacterized protein n=1 Tax=Capsaspora owczarzaki (strain ATCC 30864) TaxID=595528 RepID=A0A0D2VTZ9_CAPO3|nr:hypothetical protein CAOG_05400 [Capsaspora owczarzaki ATCC 30864]KJE94827.1 hypothetical protein CAOG_005400 [Capsaspora owczarzaki ATCC 30864]|eukprot:XP_004346073.1 hypothetical protein CAOG_05400 [Capsaspora owczarzaki ATCC 30864]